MNQMAEQIGHVIAALPGWLYIPALIIVIMVAILWWWPDIVFWPSTSGMRTNSDLGEKKHDKK
jgi:hypothetical protein